LRLEQTIYTPQWIQKIHIVIHLIHATFVKVKSESEFRTKDAAEYRSELQTIVLRSMPQILIYLHAICSQSKPPRTISRLT
jgi:hypothetical protein